MEQHKSGKLLQLLDDSLYIGAIEPLNCWQWGYRLRQWIAIVMGVGAACVFLCAGWSCVSVHQVLRQRVGRWLCNSLEYEDGMQRVLVLSCMAAYASSSMGGAAQRHWCCQWNESVWTCLTVHCIYANNPTCKTKHCSSKLGRDGRDGYSSIEKIIFSQFLFIQHC